VSLGRLPGRARREPGGTLAGTLLSKRLVACAVALVVYFLSRRNLFIGIAAGFAALTALIALGHGA